MPELPSKLDALFNIYLNILPYIEPVGFWSLLLSGVAIILYIVLGATARLVGLQKLINASSGGRSDDEEYVFPADNLLQSCYLQPLRVLPKDPLKFRRPSEEPSRSLSNLGPLPLEMEPAISLDQTCDNNLQLCCYEVNECHGLGDSYGRAALAGDAFRIR